MKLRAFSFTKPLVYWVVQFFSVDGWEVSVLWRNSGSRGHMWSEGLGIGLFTFLYPLLSPDPHLLAEVMIWP